MKTLQQEIVEALNVAGDSAVSCQIDFKLFHRLKTLSVKVEFARCENCAHWESKDNDLSNFCKFLMCGMYNNDGCWNFEQKEKSK